MFRVLAVLVLAASVLLGVRGFGLLAGTDDFGRGDPCPTVSRTDGGAEACEPPSRGRSGIALLIAAGFGLGMGFTLLVIAGRIGRVPPHRWFETPLPRNRGRDDE